MMLVKKDEKVKNSSYDIISLYFTVTRISLDLGSCLSASSNIPVNGFLGRFDCDITYGNSIDWSTVYRSA